MFPRSEFVVLISMSSEKMARESWKWFRRVEEVGGIERALTDGVIDDWMSTAADAREADVRTRTCSVVGVSDFASSRVPRIPDLAAVSSRGRGRSSATMTCVPRHSQRGWASLRI